MLFKNVDIFQFFEKAKSLLKAKLVGATALLGLDFIQATGESLYLCPYLFRRYWLWSRCTVKAPGDKLLMNKSFIRQNFGGGLTLKNVIS